jgi:hypothetical protein
LLFYKKDRYTGGQVEGLFLRFSTIVSFTGTTEIVADTKPIRV